MRARWREGCYEYGKAVSEGAEATRGRTHSSTKNITMLGFSRAGRATATETVAAMANDFMTCKRTMEHSGGGYDDFNTDFCTLTSNVRMVF